MHAYKASEYTTPTLVLFPPSLLTLASFGNLAKKARHSWCIYPSPSPSLPRWHTHITNIHNHTLLEQILLSRSERERERKRERERERECASTSLPAFALNNHSPPSSILLTLACACIAGTWGPIIVSLKTKAACPPPPPSGLKASDAYAQIMI